jgi:hypothetical protein
MNTKPTSFLVFANGSIEHAEVCIEVFIQPKKKIEFFLFHRSMTSMTFIFDFPMSLVKIGKYVR